MKAIAWLDRDGVLVRDPGYLSDPDQVQLLPGAAAAIRALNRASVACVLITNQSGIGRGYFDHTTLEKIHARLHALLAAEGARLDHVEFCPHRPEDGCACRKPGTLMARRARKTLGLGSLPQALFGDQNSDLLMARRMGARAILIRSREGGDPSRAEKTYGTLADATRWWLAELAAPPVARKILVSRLRFLGDLVLSTPLLDHLHERIPGVELDFLAEEAFLPVLQGHPTIQRTFSLPRGAGVAEVLELGNALRRERYDIVLDLFGNPRSAILTQLARPALSVGPSRGIRSRLYDHRRELPSGDPSVVRALLDFARPWLGALPERPMSLPVLGEDEANLRAMGMGEDTPWIIHPGSTWPDKAWPEARWIEWLKTQTQPLWMLTPPGEETLAERLEAHLPPGGRRLPPMGIGPLRALLRAAKGYLGHDGGVMHMAVALGCPTLALFGPTDPAIWFPHEAWGPFRVLHSPDLSKLRPSTVNESLEALGKLA